MNDEDLGRLLRDLPRAEPSFDFTARVLSRLESDSPRSRRNRAVAFVSVGAALLGVFLSQGYLRERYQRSRAAARVQELRDEYRELQTELEKLEKLTREIEPVLDLGGTENVEFVFDLRELARDGSGRPRTKPASHAPSQTEERRP
jgi:hypothetical protein